MRHDILLRPTRPGVIPFTVDHLDWRGDGSHGALRTAVTVVGEAIETPEPGKAARNGAQGGRAEGRGP